MFKKMRLNLEEVGNFVRQARQRFQSQRVAAVLVVVAEEAEVAHIAEANLIEVSKKRITRRSFAWFTCKAGFSRSFLSSII